MLLIRDFSLSLVLSLMQQPLPYINIEAGRAEDRNQVETQLLICAKLR